MKWWYLLEAPFTRNLKLKALAFLASVFFWLIILGQKTVVVTREMPIEFIVDPQYKIEVENDVVKVKFSVKQALLQNFQMEGAAPIVDVSKLPPGKNRVPILPSAFKLPLGAEIVSFEPKLVNLYLKVKRSSTKESLNTRPDNEK